MSPWILYALYTGSYMLIGFILLSALEWLCAAFDFFVVEPLVDNETDRHTVPEFIYVVLWPITIILYFCLLVVKFLGKFGKSTWFDIVEKSGKAYKERRNSKN